MESKTKNQKSKQNKTEIANLRFMAFLVDQLFIFFIMSISVSVQISLFNRDILDNSFLLIILVVISGYLFKDLVFHNQSIGKKMFNVEVVTYDNKLPTIWQMILRNIPFIIIGGIELFIYIFANERLGDMWAKTQVVQSGHINK